MRMMLGKLFRLVTKRPVMTNNDLSRLRDAFPRLLPVLLTTFSESPDLAYQIASELNSIDIPESRFPYDPADFKSLCENFGHSCNNEHLEKFAQAQMKWFAREVSAGDHVDYNDDEVCPYAPQAQLSEGNSEASYTVKAFQTKTGNYWEKFWKERNILSALHHPNIHKFWGSFSLHNFEEYSFLFSPCDQTLESYLRSQRHGTPSTLNSTSEPNLFAKWMLGLSSALAYFHGLGGLHKHIDLNSIIIRSSNIYLSGYDFYYDDIPGPVSQYQAPEFYKPNLTRRADIYSLGRVFLDLIFLDLGIVPAAVEEWDYYSSEDHFLCLSTSFSNLLTTHNQSPLLCLKDLVLLKMMNWSPGCRLSAVHLKKDLSHIFKTAMDIEAHYDELESVYPDMSPESVRTRFLILLSNMERGQGPQLVEQITQDLVEGGDEKIFYMNSIEDLKKTGPFGRCIFLD